MGTELTFKYSHEADVLCVLKCPTYEGQETEEIDDLVIARMNSQTREIEYLEILLLLRRINRHGKLSLPVDSTLSPTHSIVPKAQARPATFKANLTIDYNHENDTLNLGLREPGSGQDEAEICDGATARLNPESGEIESLTIRSFKARAERDGEIVLPIKATFHPAKSTVPAE